MKTIKEISERLKETLAGLGNWAIITDPNKERNFVQFSTGRTHTEGAEPEIVFILDLPCKALTFEEGDRATKWFNEHGCSKPQREPYLNDAGESWLLSWKLPLRNDAVDAACVAISLFSAVYGLPDDLVIETGIEEEEGGAV